MNQSFTFPSQTNMLVDVVLERIRESVVDERDVLGPLRDSVPESAPAIAPHPRPFVSQVPTVMTRPVRRVPRWPVVLCGTIALAFGLAAAAKSPWVGEAKIKRAAIAIHDALFKV